MVCPLRRHRYHGVLRLGRGIDAVVPGEVHLESRRIRITPAALDLLPWQPLPCVDPVPVAVEGNALKLPIVLDDQDNIIQRVFDATFPVKLQAFPPVLPVCEFLSGLPAPLLQGLYLHAVNRQRKIAHCLEGRFVIKFTEFVDADKVKGIAEFQIGRVFCMVAVGEFSALLDFHARHAAGLDQVVAVFLVRRLIYILQESVHGKIYREEHPVEQSHHALFFKRVLHLLYADGICPALP